MAAMAATASSLAAVRLLRASSPSLSLAAPARFTHLNRFPRSSSLSFHLRSGLHHRIVASAAPSVAFTSVTPISVGDKLPDANLSFLDSADEVQTVTVSDLTKGKKVVLFAVPGAFTPTCSQKHLPGFVEKSGECRPGVDTIACVSVNDAFVMKAWKENLNVGDEVLLLSDGNGDFTRALGVELDLRDKPVGLGVRSRRYALLAEDGVVKVLNLEEGGAFTISSADDILRAL
ncbi:hypothetical protein HPP92_011560 [Vanilla planifolia]|uniref:Glutaredoxin-dependent peroxiredoxin n=1 Tax=Vanilla planifolia TaxID=51239 RepID=A0A835R7A7_VANPL|nr:hypothetical protein HPP92_011560 [Vanilla planifolia]